MSFAMQVAQWANKAEEATHQALREVVVAGVTGVVARSPVDTQRFRDSWRVGINAPDLQVVPPRTNEAPNPNSGSPVPITSEEIARLRTYLAAAKFGDTVYITNSIEYGPALEDGHSKQAPHGMLALTVNLVRIFMPEIIQRVASSSRSRPGRAA